MAKIPLGVRERALLEAYTKLMFSQHKMDLPKPSVHQYLCTCKVFAEPAAAEHKMLKPIPAVCGFIYSRMKSFHIEKAIQYHFLWSRIPLGSEGFLHKPSDVNSLQILYQHSFVLDYIGQRIMGQIQCCFWIKTWGSEQMETHEVSGHSSPHQNGWRLPLVSRSFRPQTSTDWQTENNTAEKSALWTNTCRHILLNTRCSERQ